MPLPPLLNAFRSQGLGQNLKHRLWNRIRSVSSSSSATVSSEFPTPAASTTDSIDSTDDDDDGGDEGTSDSQSEDPFAGIAERASVGQVLRSLGPSLDEKILSTPEWSICAVCSEVYKNPVRWQGCDHSFCRGCCQSLLTFGHRHCPLCRRFLPNDCGIDDLIPNVALVNELSRLPARCKWAFRASSLSRRTAVLGSSLPDTVVNSLRVRPQQDPSDCAVLFSPAASTLFDSYMHINSPVLLSSRTTAHSPPPTSLSKSLTISSVEDLPTSLWQLDPDGCAEVLQIATVQQHELSCSHKLIPCENRGCGRLVKALHAVQHRAECPFGSDPCSSCRQLFPRGSIVFHEMNCPEAIVGCVCGTQLMRAEFARHIKETCPVAPGALPCDSSFRLI